MRRSTFTPPQPGTVRLSWRLDRLAVALFVVVFALVFALMLTLAAMASATDSKLLPSQRGAISGLPACATEDSDDCYWDSGAMGNGVGESFAMIDGERIPWCTDEIADARGVCWGPLR